MVIATAFNFFEVWGNIPHLPGWANPRQTTADVSDVKQATGLFASIGDRWLQERHRTLYGPELRGGYVTLFLAIILLTINQIKKIGSEST